jgi:hypothetical protein
MEKNWHVFAFNVLGNKGSTQHAIKNIGQKVVNLNDITFNNRLGSLTGKCFEIGNKNIPPIRYGLLK